MVSLKPSQRSAVLGLALDGRQLEAVVLSRSNGGLKASPSLRVSLALDPLTNDPELVGREIRNHLDEAGLRERHCTLCLPTQLALTQPAKVPNLPEADVGSFLQLEAERGFPYAPDDLSVSVSRFRAPNGEQHASLVAIPKSHLTLLEKTLRAARLKPLSFSLGISALQDVTANTSAGLLTLVVAETCVELQVSTGGGVAALRSLEGAFDTEGAQRHVDADLVLREIRITLGQLPKDLRETVKRIRVFGRSELTAPLLREIAPLAQDMGMAVEGGTALRLAGLAVQGPDSGNPTRALSLAAQHLAGTPPVFEFLPPKVSAWKQAVTRFSSGRIVYAGAAAAGVLLVVAAAFLWQEWRLVRLGSQWKAIKPKVSELEALQRHARKFRPWFDESARSLRILRTLTAAFPEDGAVSAKNLEIKDLSEVTCSGQARDNLAWLGLRDRLGKEAQVTNLTVPQVSGQSPVKFTFSYRWVEGVAHDK